jgi:predicted aspartyl protease
LQVLDTTGLIVDLEASIDTGFSGFLTLPPDLIAVLQIPYERSDIFVLGDNSEAELHLYAGRLLWHGQDKSVILLAAEGIPLIGMSLLEGSDLFVHVVAGGEVRIEEWP